MGPELIGDNLSASNWVRWWVMVGDPGGPCPALAQVPSSGMGCR